MIAKTKSDNLRYSIIPARAITDPGVTAQALRVLALLGRHGDDNGWCRRSQVKMAKELACSRGTIQNALDLLIGPDNGTHYVERREETRPGVEREEGRHPHCAYSYRVRLDLDDAGTARANRLAGRVPVEKHAVPALEKHPVPDSVAPLTEHSPCERPIGNSPAAPPKTEIASLRKGSTEDWPIFRSTVAKTWPNGFPARDEVACSKAFEHATRLHAPGLVIACAAQHGAALTRERDARHDPKGQIVKRPSNWLREGEWQGYIPLAEEAERREAEVALALGRVKEALGQGVFDLLRRRGMPDAAIAKLDGMTVEPGPPPIIVAAPFQRIMLDKHTFALEQHYGDRINFVMTEPERRSA